MGGIAVQNLPRAERRQTSRRYGRRERSVRPVYEEDSKTEEAGTEGASPYDSWDTIPWERAELHVNRLQTRIAVAEKEGRTEDVRSLQRRLTNSFDAKLLAVRAVTTSGGKSTPGVDNVTWDTPKAKLEAAKSLTTKGYRAKPLRRVLIPKRGKPGQTRPLGIPTMYDRAMQALWAIALDPVAEVRADRFSFGFRRGRSAKDACARLFLCLSRHYSPQWVLEGDIRGCFDNISHEWLMEHVPMDKAVMAQFLKAGFMEQGRWHETASGTPQGGVISPVYCNLALDGMERLLDEHFASGRKRPSVKVNACRYADDFVVTAASPEVAEEAKRLLVPFLRERGLELSDEKTLVTHIADGFDFLGWNFRKYDGKLIIKPSRKSVKAFVAETHRTILVDGKGMTQDQLIRALQPKVRGFAAYHRHTCCSETFSTIAYTMYHQLWRWACRRHPKKSTGWVRGRYWRKVGDNSWTFGTPEAFLAPITWQRVVRHPQVKSDMNPYLDRPYFEERRRSIDGRASKSFRAPAQIH